MIARRARLGDAPTAHAWMVAVAAACAGALAGCRGALDQSALEPAGPQAAKLMGLWRFSVISASAVWMLTVAAMLFAAWHAWRRTRRGEGAPAGSERTMTVGVSIATAATVVVLLVFFSYDLSVGRTLSPIPSRQPLTIEVIGHQWWWEIHYDDSIPNNRLTTANEIHIPVGEPVLFRLQAQDVIHSIWVPNLGGKKDLIPGYTQTVWFQADTPGVYRGQCAEFCGLQHAKMALFIVAEPKTRYAQWAAQMKQPAQEPSDSLAKKGGEIFMTGTCAMCHSIDGTSAGSSAGPDLTHLASRRTIGAGTLPNTRGNLAGWIVDPQGIKPGVRMPPNMLKPKDLDALLAYLQGLR